MIKIRKGVFETNSSSVHTLTYASSLRSNFNLPINEDNEIVVDYGEFGCSGSIFGQYEKLSYILTQFSYLFHSESDLRGSTEFNALLQALRDHSGNPTVNIRINKTEGYIDHQSVWEDCWYSVPFNLNDPEAYKNFLFIDELYIEMNRD